MFLEKRYVFFSASYRWQKLLARKNCSRTNICVVVASSDNMPTMASADYHSGIPSLPTMPSPGGNNNQWSWMIVVCLGAGWVAPRRPWTMAAAMVDLCVCWLFLVVFCVMFYVDDIAVITENMLISISNDKIV
jgi:hypothetical protein